MPTRMKNQRDRIAAAIRASRRAKGLSQEQLAEQIDVAPEHLSALERGVNAPSLETFAALVRVLGLDAARLLEPARRSGEADRERRRLEAEVVAMAENLPDVTLREWFAIGQVLAKRHQP